MLRAVLNLLWKLRNVEEYDVFDFSILGESEYTEEGLEYELKKQKMVDLVISQITQFVENFNDNIDSDSENICQ